MTKTGLRVWPFFYCERASKIHASMTAMSTALSLRKQMSELETLLVDSPDESFDQMITDVKLEFKLLKTLIQRSTIAPDHQVKQRFEGLRLSLAHPMSSDKKSSKLDISGSSDGCSQPAQAVTTHISW